MDELKVKEENGKIWCQLKNARLTHRFCNWARSRKD